MGKIIAIKGLTKKFGKIVALDGVDMVIEEGRIHGFLGPNGAGKTTTIRNILGIIKPTSGTVAVFGQDAFKDAVAIHKNLAYVPGESNLWDNLTGGEVIDLFLSLHGKKNSELKEKYLKLFDLDPRKKCRTYSKGNKQKVALVAAFASDVDLYILDEPTSGLDPLMEKVFQDIVQDLKKQGKTVLLSSHILSEVEKLADDISIIKDGKIIISGKREKVLKDESLETLFLSEFEVVENV